MANPFLDALDEYRRRDQPAAAPQPTAPLPTRYGEVAIPGGQLIDADTFTQGPEKFRVAGVDAPELQNKRTGEVLRPGQEAYRDAAPLFREPVQPDRTGVDIHGRSTARPLTADGRDLGAEMVRRGIAEPKDWNRSGVMPYVREAAARFDETHPPSEAAQAMAEFRGGKLSGKTIVPEPPDPKKRGYLEELGAGLKRGIDQGQSGLYGAVSMAGKLLSDESRGSDPLSWQEGDPRLTLRDRVTNWLQRVGNTGAMRNEEQAGQNPAAYSFDDVLKGKGDLLQWIAGSVGEAAPSTAIMAAGAMATGGVGALLEGSALRGTAGAALKELAVNAAEGSAATALRRKLLTSGILSDTVTPVMLNQVAKDIVANPVKYALKTQAAKAGGFLGAWGGSAALEGGSAWTEAQKALGPDADPRYSLGAGLAAGLLDTAALHVMLQPFAKAFATPVAEAAMATVPGRTLAEKTGSLVASIGKAGLRGILAEAPTEMAQEVIAAASVEAQKKSDAPLIDRLMAPDYIKRYIEAGAAGMAFGGLFSGVGGAVGHIVKPNTSAVNIDQQAQNNKGTLSDGAQKSSAETLSQKISDAVLADTQSPLGVTDAMPVGQEIQSDIGIPYQGSTRSDTGGVEPVPDRGYTDTKLFGDSGAGQAVREQGLGSLNVDRQREVLAHMRTALHDDEVVQRVVSLLPVSVVDVLGLKERTPENFLHNKSVLFDALSVPRYESVTALQRRIVDEIAASFPSTIASGGAERSGSPTDLTGLTRERDATIGVGADASRHSSTPGIEDTKDVGVPASTRTPAPTISQSTTAARPPAGPIGPVLNEGGAPIAPPEERGYDDERKAIMRRQMELLAERERQGAAAPEELPPAAPEELPTEARPDLPETGNRYLAKDRGKWARATKFIGQGSPASSTKKYADALGGLANSGSYTAEDRVFVSAEGARGGRIEPDFAEIQKALDAGATIITDGRSDRERGYNIGERQVASFLGGRGYVEEGDTGVWRPAVATGGATSSAPREASPSTPSPTSPPFPPAAASPPAVDGQKPSAGTSAAPTASAQQPVPAASKESSRASDTSASNNVSPSIAPLSGEQLAFFEGPEAPLFRQWLLNPLSLDGADSTGKRPSPRPGAAERAPVVRTPLSAEALRDPAVRKGANVAKQLINAWADLLGVARADVDITVEQAKALAGEDPKPRYDATLKLARHFAKTFVGEKWDSAGDETRKKVWAAYNGALKTANGGRTTLDFDSWLAREVGDSLLNDERVRKIYADADMGLAYRWLRGIGVALAKLANHVLSRFTHSVKEHSPAVAEFVHDLIDHRRTELAERNGLSPENSRRFKEATNRLMGGEAQAARLDDLEQNLIEDRAGPLYKRWLAALRRVQALAENRTGVDETGAKLFDQVQVALREVIDRAAGPLWQTPGPLRRRFLRERATDVLRALPAVRKADPEIAGAVEEIARSAAEIEDALAIARSFGAVAGELTPEKAAKTSATGRSLSDLLVQSEQSRDDDRVVARAFLDAVRQPAETDAVGAFDDQFKHRSKESLVARFRDALKDREALAEALRENDAALTGTGAKALLAAFWKGLGFAVEDTPGLVPTGDVWGRVGVQIDPEASSLESLPDETGRYAAATRLMEKLPAAHRDALARAYVREGEGDPVTWFGEQIALALRGDPVLWLTLYRSVPETASDAEGTRRLATERRAYNHLLSRAVTTTEFAAPEVVEALRYRLRARYGNEVVDRSAALLGKADSPLHAWFLLAQGYAETADGSPSFTEARAKTVRKVLADARMLLELTPGLDEAEADERARFLSKNLPALQDHRAAFKRLAPGKDLARALVDWFDRLDLARQDRDELSPGEAVDEAETDDRAEVDDEETWMASAVEDGAARANESEFRQEIEDASERKTVLENVLALMSEYTPSTDKVSVKTGKPYRTKAGLYRRFQVLGGESGTALLNSDQSTTFDAAVGLGERFEADIDDANFRALPPELKHVLLQRAQVLARMGAVPEYSLAEHVTHDGRAVRYVKERLTLSDRATVHVSPLKNGSVVSDQLLLDFVRGTLETSNRYTSRWADESKFGSAEDPRFGAIEFDVRAALDHPLLARLMEAIDRDPRMGRSLREYAAEYAVRSDPALLTQGRALLPALRQSIELDPALHRMMSEDGTGFAQMLAAALGHDQDVFFNDYSPGTIDDPSLRPHERPTQTKMSVFVEPSVAEALGLKQQKSKKGKSYYEWTVKGPGAVEDMLATFLKLFVIGYDPKTETVKSGVRATVSADALVGVGGKTLTGMEASPNSNFDRAHRLYRGFDLASQLPNPWVPVDPFWRTWHGLNSEKLESDPHMNLIVFKSAEETVTLRDTLADRKVADILQGNGEKHTSFKEKSLGELDEDVQYWMGRIDALFQRVDEANSQRRDADADGLYDEQATNDYGTPIWSFSGVMPAEILTGLKQIAVGKRSAVPWHFTAKKALTLNVAGTEYTARPFSLFEELQYSQSRIGKLRARIGELRATLKQDGLINAQRGLSGSELSYYQHVEEELGRLEARIEQLGIGNYSTRVNSEQALFNPDLNSPKVQWDADFKGHGYEGLRGLEAPGEQKGKGDATPQAKDLPPPGSRLSDVLTRFAAHAADLLGLGAGDYKISVIGTDALMSMGAVSGKSTKEMFGDMMRNLDLAELADHVWERVVEEPVFVVGDRIIAFDADLSSGKKLSAEYLKRAIAHEMGHLYFREKVQQGLAGKGARTSLIKQLMRQNAEWEGKLTSDLLIEEAVAETVAAQLVGEAGATPKLGQTLLGRIVSGIAKAWRALVGNEREDLEALAAHNTLRALQRAGVSLYAGRKLLENTKAVGEGTWATMKDLYSTVVRTSHSWLRSQLDAKGAPIDAFKLMADILRWTPGVAPVSRSFGGQTFDFTSTDGDYRISYEQATQRHFARFGHRVEAMLDSWNLPSEKASFWDAKKRAEIAEAQRQRQVQAVRDHVNGVKTKQSVELGQFFDALGDYFGDVLKRYDPAKALPRIFDQTALRERKDDFLALLEGSGVEAEEAEQIWSRLTKEAGSDYRNDANAFFAPHFQRARMGDALDALSDKELLPFLLIDSQPQAALWQYVHQAVKRTEFERRFGGWVYFDKAVDFSPEASVKPRLVSPADETKMRGARPVGFNKNGMPQYELPNGKTVIWDHTAKWRMLRAEAAAQGATPGQLNRFLKITEAELGRLGADFSPRLRTLQSALIAGMNWAVLPLSLTSQPTDLALPLLRANGDFASAWKGMKTALRELRSKGDLYAAAKANGVLAGNLRNYFASSYLDAPYMDSWAMRWNERLFKLNGMEKATEFVRMFAFATGSEWIKSLAAKNTDEANAQLAQLGLDRADVLAWQAGQEKLDTGEGAPDEASERVQQALDTFVEQSMFRPSASQRPTWASHPAAMLVWYLKSYIWAYADTILSRTWREFRRMDGYGQKALVLAMPALFMLPLAMLGLALRDELRDDLNGIVPWRMPKREREETATDEIARLIGRTGLLGPMQTLIDAGRASEYGSPYYLALIGPFATMTDQAVKRIGSAGEGKVTKSVAESLMQLSPVLGSLPQERRSLANWAF